MTNEKEKTKFGKFLQNVGLPILRGAVKQIPIVGTPLTEIVTNLITPKDEPKKHTNISLIVQCCIAGMIVLDIVVNKGANLKEIFSIAISFLK